MNLTLPRNAFRVLTALFLLGATLVPALQSAAALPAAPMHLVSRAYDGGPALTAADASAPAISGDGRYVAFVSTALNFDPRANGLPQVYLRDVQADTLELISVTNDGAAADGACAQPSITPDGRYIAFVSQSPALGAMRYVPGIFVRDRAAGTTERVDLRASGAYPNGGRAENPVLSGDGRFVAFVSSYEGFAYNDRYFRDVFVRDRRNRTTERVSGSPDGTSGNGDSGVNGIAMDATGRLIAFVSVATNLLPDRTEPGAKLFLFDRSTNTLSAPVSASGGVGPDGEFWAPALSSGGRYLAFASTATNLVAGSTGGGRQVFLRDLQSGDTELISRTPEGAPAGLGDGTALNSFPVVSTSGRYVSFVSTADDLVPGDRNRCADTFCRDRLAARTTRLTASPAGEQANDETDPNSAIAANPNGRFVAFASRASNLVAGDTGGALDVFVSDILSGSPVRASVSTGGTEGVTGATSYAPVVSADGRYTAFTSNAFNLVPDDHNGAEDVFVWDRASGTTQRVSVSSAGEEQAPAHPWHGAGRIVPTLSADGRFVAYTSHAGNLAPGDTNGTADLFVRDLRRESTERIDITAAGGELARGCQEFQQPAVSADGRFVAYLSSSAEIIPFLADGEQHCYLRDRLAGVNELVSVARDGSPAAARSAFSEVPTRLSMSNDGSKVAFESPDVDLVPNDTNYRPDVFVRDRSSQTNERVSVPTNGGEVYETATWPTLSEDGRYVSFRSDSYLAVRDRLYRSTLYPTYGYRGITVLGLISGDGHSAAFSSPSKFAVPNDPNHGTDAFLADIPVHVVERVSVALGGAELPFQEGDSYVGVSRDGRFVAFDSMAPSILPGVRTGRQDVYLRDRSASIYPPVAAGALTAACTAPSAIQLAWQDRSADEQGFRVEWSQDGSAFQQLAAVPANVTTFKSASFAPDHLYSFRVAAFNDIGSSAYSNVASSPSSAPAALTALTAALASGTSIRLTWKDNSRSESRFEVERLASDGTYQPVGTAAANAASWTQYGLARGSSYSYRVRAVNAVGPSAYTNTAAARTPP